MDLRPQLRGHRHLLDGSSSALRHFEAIDDTTTTLLNLLGLMAMAALPFPSAVMGRYGQERAAVILYAASMAVAGTLTVSLWVVADHRHLLPDRATKAEINAGLWRGGSTAVVFALSIPVAVVAPRVAPYIWIIVLLLRVVPGVRRRRATRAVT